MAEFARHLDPVNIEDEMRQSYMDYAMSVIVGRALPDVRDGLKPVHRRILFSMQETNNVWNRPYVKCARVVGDVLGKYHPHGDTATYDALVRMAQSFAMRYMLVDGQGNFGSIDGDPPAAYRYTECRMMQLASEMLADIDKETVDFVPNYDEKELEPTILPTRVPALLVNGSAGIAVGMATNIPPHNLREVVNACIAMIDQPAIGPEELMELVPGPDFPTAGIINGAAGIREAYRTGRGRIYVRARANVEGEEGEMQSIIVTELPYQVNKARLLEKIAELVKEKKLEGIRELRDESDKDGMRMVIELRRGEVPEVVLNNLYQQTQMQSVFGINMVALVDGQPQLLNLRQMIECFIRHRREVVSRRTVFELRKARSRAHTLEGLAVALANIDRIIETIRRAADPAAAKDALVSTAWAPGIVTTMLARAGADLSRPDGLDERYGLKDAGYYLSPAQAQAILDLRLHRLTALAQDEVHNEYEGIIEQIQDLLDILARPERLMQVIREELVEIRDKYGDERRTEIQDNLEDLRPEDLIPNEPVVVTLSHAGYAKSQQLDVYRAQRRGGRGKTATSMKDEDFVAKLFVANTHDTLLCFSSAGKVYWLKVYQVPQAGRSARGRPIVNLLPLVENERITAILPVDDYEGERYILMATAAGTVKKTALEDFSRPRTSGIIAVDLNEGDELVGVAITDGRQEAMLFSSSGKAICFNEDGVRAMGRTARGVRGIRLPEGHRVISLIIREPGMAVLTATTHGYGKRTAVEDFPLRGRGGQGVIAIQTSTRNGDLVSAVSVSDDDDVMLISDRGTLVRTPVADISTLGRNTQGVRLIRLGEDERLVGTVRIGEINGNGDDDNDDDGAGDEAAAGEDTPADGPADD